uniref:Uncharacterized protein n=1 Tax=Corethron hystrix TaxID=216773 RepID=A0A7S1BSW4_9STRA|mmetsp:Transcript_38838/g.90332  ORF Transcript_38838/g.90332 Transcript_38838/m.90332 type:complete len:204 (+) Transcript_38838:316-927(+)|eukprot:CAMPEP_0113304560 /NCGR_PEP_ID=MMETSP0010_2-20120614/4534_1 /TAXON_ID=216773 ORGANISM="Corethron hystrix, Strain 308" /NCGR_SAMPLE_ID=MMETSP0010_2 /ASSEMBLY_ACC=CAM_ASM_000155 /LENGTH=203 /DNA_ID=CAMNT_0000158795 /DNA_START=180 /DNA_END=791 /DNA_ORIENTATION=+ /assembly_acc=CAM_ASM_000155
MTTSLILASLLASATAFAPVSQQASSTALKAFESELGSQPPLGFFDPLGLLADANQERFDRLRYVELKHGRVCQLAFLGQITTRAGVHLPGSIDNAGDSFDSFPDGWAGLSAIPQAGLFQIIAFVGFLELFVMKDSANGAAPGDFVGDFRNGSLDFGWDKFDEDEKMSKRAIELNNGRAAMMGILGLMIHEQLGTDLPIIGQL